MTVSTVLCPQLLVYVIQTISLQEYWSELVRSKEVKTNLLPKCWGDLILIKCSNQFEKSLYIIWMFAIWWGGQRYVHTVKNQN